MKKLFILVMLLSILSISVSATLTFDQPDLSEWKQYGFDRWSTNAYNYPFSAYFGGVDNETNFTYTDSVAFGGNFQPTAYDWDADGTTEIIVSGSNFQNVYTASANEFNQEYSNSISGSVSVPPSCFEWSDDADQNVADNDRFCVYAIGSTIYTNYYEENTIKSYASATLASGLSLISGWSCHVDNFDYTTPYCFAYADNTTQARQYIVQYRADQNNDVSYVNTYAPLTEDVSAKNDFNTKPIITDLDYDDNMEVVYTGASGGLDYILALEWNATTNAVALDTGLYGGDGYYTWASSAEHDDILAYDIDGATDEEVCVFYRTGNTPTINCLSTDNTNSAVSLVTASGYTPTSMVYADFDGDNTGELAAVVSQGNATNVEYLVYLIETSTGTLTSKKVYNFYSDYTSGTDDILSATAVEMNNDNYYDLVLGKYIIYFDSDGNVTSVDEKNIEGTHSVPVNVNNDAYMDILSMKLNNLYFYSGYTGVGAESGSSITLNTALNNSGFYGYNPNPCVGDAQTIRALESPTGILGVTYTYNNSDVDSERLASACGGASVFANGSYDNWNPQITCNFTAAGTYTARVFIQDTGNPTDYSVYDDIVFVATAGVVGQDCSLPSDLITAPNDQDAEETDDGVLTDEEILTQGGRPDHVMRAILGDNTGWALLGAIILIFGVWSTTMAMANKYKVELGAVGHMVSIFLGIILATFLGLLSSYILVLILIFMVILVLLKVTGKGGN